MIIGADIDLAIKYGADGVHFPRWFSTSAQTPNGMIVTASAHDATELHRAKDMNADLALLSPAFPTKSHPEAMGQGENMFRTLASTSPIPVLALGGVNETNALRLSGPNVVGLAAISAFTE